MKGSRIRGKENKENKEKAAAQFGFWANQRHLELVTTEKAIGSMEIQVRIWGHLLVDFVVSDLRGKTHMKNIGKMRVRQ